MSNGASSNSYRGLNEITGSTGVDAVLLLLAEASS